MVDFILLLRHICQSFYYLFYHINHSFQLADKPVLLSSNHLFHHLMNCQDEEEITCPEILQEEQIANIT